MPISQNFGLKKVLYGCIDSCGIDCTVPPK